MSETTDNIQRRRERHHKALEIIAMTVNCKTPGIKLWRKLASLERKGSIACEQYSNDAGFGIERWEAVKDEARAELASIFGGTIPEGVFLNGDPRGHFLKLDCDEVPIPEGMERDWGGNGLLAAEINEVES